MAKAKVIHNQDGCTLVVKGDISSPEPSTHVIKFKGGHVEVSRCSDGEYWAHICVNDDSTITDSRIGYSHEAGSQLGVLDIPRHTEIKQIAIKLSGVYKED